MKALGYIIGCLIGLLSYVITIVFNYHAWVDHDLLCQIVLWIIVPFSIVGLCLPESPVNMGKKVCNVFFWVFTSITIPIQMWIWFGGHSDIGIFYGIISLMVTFVALILGTLNNLKTK